MAIIRVFLITDDDLKSYPEQPWCFTIDSSTGVVSTNGSLDYEFNEYYVITVIATNKNVPYLMSNTKVTIFVHHVLIVEFVVVIYCYNTVP